MFSWAARIILLIAGAITSLFVAEDLPTFGLIQAMVAFLLIAGVVFVIAFWPERWSHILNRHGRPK